MTTVKSQPVVKVPPRTARLGFLQQLIPPTQNLQPKILLFTFGAALAPVVLLTGLAWRFVHQPLLALERSRLDDQVLAFKGYTASTEKGIKAVTTSYAIWTDLFDAVQKKDQAWIKQEVSDQLVFSTDNIDAVLVINRQGEVLGQRNQILQLPQVAEKINALAASLTPKQPTSRKPESKDKGEQAQALMDTKDGRLLLLSVAAIYRSDGTGASPGILVLGQILDRDWLNDFLNFSHPSTRLEVLSLQGQPLSSSQNIQSHLQLPQAPPQVISPALTAVQQGHSRYEIQPESGFDTVYAPILAGSQPVAMVEIQIEARHLNRAMVVLQRQAWLGLSVAVVLSIAIARRLARQIAQPINHLAERSKTLAAGDLSAPIPGIGSGGELGQLADAYQEMAQALQTLIDNLEHRVAERTQELELARQTLEDRVRSRTEELWHKNQQLQQANEQTQQLNAELAAQTQQLEQALDDLQHTQAQLIQTEKMSSLGQMVAGIAHEINNPVGFVYGNLAYTERYTQTLLTLVQLYQEEYPTPSAKLQNYIETIDLDFLIEDLPQILNSMKVGAERIHRIVLSLRIFSRLNEADIKRVDLHEGIDSTLLILQSRLKAEVDHSKIRVVKEYGDLPLIECFAGKLNQVFMNILSNAIDAIAKPEAETIEQQVPRQGQITIRTEKLGDHRVRIRIADNGVGMSETVKARLFDPFFTTKPVGKGTGLGLSICYEIVVKKHRGILKCSSEPGEGAEFWIELPIQQRLVNPD